MGGGGGGQGDRSPANFSVFDIIPTGGAWKESTSNGHRLPNRLAPWRRPCTALQHNHGHAPKQ